MGEISVKGELTFQTSGFVVTFPTTERLILEFL